MSKKYILLGVIITATILMLPNFTPNVQAVEVVEGDLITATGDIDVWIVKYAGAKKFKRLILNPDVFNMYGHLNWEDIKIVDKSVVDSFTESTLVRADGDTKVYKLYPSGDTGQKKWIQTSGVFNAWGFDWDAAYIINTFDRDSYVTATPMASSPSESDSSDSDDSSSDSTTLTAPVLQDPGSSIISGTAFNITWSTSENATSYTLQRDTSSSFISPTVVYAGSNNTTADTRTPTALTTYYYRVSATYASGDSSWSNTTDIQVTVEGVPDAPTLTDPGVSVNTGNSFTLNWSAVSNVTVYVLEQDTNSSFSSPTTVVSTGPSITSDTVTLTPGITTTYYYRVQARNNIGSGAWSNVVNMQVIVAEPSNNAPVLTSVGNKSVDEGSLLEFTVSATDTDGDSLVYSASGIPTGGSFNASTKTFSWAPAYDKSGTYSVTFTVTDGSVSDSETITITVVDITSIPQNGGFEDGNLNYWTKTGTWAVSTTRKHTGSYSAHIYTGSSGGTAGLMYTFDYPIPVDDISSFTWWYYREGGDNICVGITYSDGTYEQDFIWGATSNAWTQRNSTGILNAGKSISKITFFDAISNNHTYIDDVQLQLSSDILGSYAGPDTSSAGIELTDFFISGDNSVGGTITAQYTFRNTKSYTLNFTPYGILVGCRNPSWTNKDFGSTGILALGSGESYTFTAEKVVDTAGTWRFWPAYYINSSWGPYRWNEITVDVGS